MPITNFSDGESNASVRSKLNRGLDDSYEPIRSGLLAEYRFDEGSGSVLTDRSGNGRNATIVTEGTAPTWTKQGICFNGERQTANHSHAALPSGFIGNARTVMCVCKLPTPYAQYDSFLGSLQVGSTSGKPLMVSGTTGDTDVGLRVYGANGASLASDSFGVAEWVCHTWTGPSSGNDRLFQNELEATQYLTQGNSNAVPFLDPAFIGKWQMSVNTNNFGSKLTYAYWVAYDRVLTDDEIAYNVGVMRRACEARGIRFMKPKSVITQVDAINIVGDSITAGSGASTGSNKYAQIFSDYAVTLGFSVSQMGVSGKQVRHMTENMRWAFSKNYGRGKKVCTVFAGTNDVAAGQTALQTFQSIIAFYQECYSKNIDVIVSTMLSRGSGAGYDSQKNALNSYIRSYFPRPGAYLVDPASNPGLGSDYQSINFTGDTTSGSPVVVNISSTAGWYAGMYVNGTNVPSAGSTTGLGGTAILSVDSATQITLNTNATVTQTGASLNIKTGASNLFYMNTDNTHPKDTGHALIAGYFKSALAACLNANAQPVYVGDTDYTMTGAESEVCVSPVAGSRVLTLCPATGLTGKVVKIRNLSSSVNLTVVTAAAGYSSPIRENILHGAGGTSFVLTGVRTLTLRSLFKPNDPHGNDWAVDSVE